MFTKLQNELLDVQRVLSLLVTKPEQPLTELNLDTYTILDCEPLHDLKGHLTNILEELPNILTGETKTIVKELNKKRGPSGSDARVALLEINNIIQCRDVDQNIKMLLLTAVKISERLYSSDVKRTPKNILQLYNCSWLHHELCKTLFSKPKEITYEKLFGLYLHSIVVHAPLQYEIVCLKSVNTENQERLFQQAKSIASKCSNRKPDNVISAVILRLQARAISGKLSNIYEKVESRVGSVASKSATSYFGTTVSKTFIKERPQSWQAHLSRISSFIVHEQIWWKEEPDNFVFLDGDNDPDYRDEGPVLRHFRSCVIQDIEKQSADIWKHIMDTNIKIPAEAQTVRIYDEDGEFVSYRNHHTSEIEDEFENHQNDEMFDFSPIKDNSQSFSATPTTECPTTSTPVKENEPNARRQLSLNEQHQTNEINCTITEPTCVSVKYSSTYAVLLADIFGDDPHFARFDFLHTEVKSKQGNVSKYTLQSIQRHSTNKRIKEKSATLQQLNAIQTDNQADCLPIDSQIENDLHSEFKKINRLLRSWKI